MRLKFLVALILIALISCNITPPERKEIKKSKDKIQIVFEGVVYPYKECKIISPISARIKKIYKQNGEKIKPSDILLEFNTKDFEIDYKQALIDYKIAKIRAGKIQIIHSKYNSSVLINNAKEKLLKTYSLYKHGYASLSELKNAENEYEDLLNRINSENSGYNNSISEIKRQKEAEEEVKKAKLELEKAQEKLKYRYIRCPMRGFLVNLNTQQGSFVDKNDDIGSIVDIDKIKLKGAFFPGTYKFLHVGMIGNIQCLTTPTYNAKGAIEELSPVVDPKTGRMSLFITLKNKNYILQPGTKCLISFVFKTKDIKDMGLDTNSKKIYIKSKIKSNEIK